MHLEAMEKEVILNYDNGIGVMVALGEWLGSSEPGMWVRLWRAMYRAETAGFQFWGL